MIVRIINRATIVKLVVVMPTNSIHSRIPAEKTDVSVLGQSLKFRNGRAAQNRFLKVRFHCFTMIELFQAALSERLASYDTKDLSKRGVISQRLVNVYDKWGNGKYGIVLTGNVHVDPEHLESPGNIVFNKQNDCQQSREMASKLANASKQDGGLVIAQISHGGRQTPYHVNPHPYSCSDIQLANFGKPIALSEEQIKTDVVDKFLFTAKFASEQGWRFTDYVFKCGFDFVELSGGTYEQSAFMHKRESTRKREAFFLEFAEQLRPCFEKTVVYLTGGFRTAPAMVRAIADKATDGIGLGRPITAEPDLPAKILRGECLSAPDTKLDPDNFQLALQACLLQMAQMGKHPLSELRRCVCICISLHF
ncbi:unnamed protein product [Nippostrongylus brasiliensis]|uniref:Oxidored_FMN domain-containing protein n=1 Tax=Nippostrongylus brasiliensis TaxID=27835 RepID=A0A158QXY7_NIPBR|nr:unnamed protein product [Nippostrongylus brasiliensis]